MSATRPFVKVISIPRAGKNAKLLELKQIVSARLRQLLGAKRPPWKAADLARALGEGVSPTMVASWVRGERLPNASYAAQLSQVLGVDADQLFSMGGPAVREPRPPYNEVAGPIEGPGWLWAEGDELEDQLRSLIRNVDRTVRGHITDEASLRDIRLDACRGLMRSAEIAGRSIPPVLVAIYNEVIEGRFR